MRLARVPLVVIQDHVINLNLLANAYVEKDNYGSKWVIRYFMDTATMQEDDNGAQGACIEFASKKAALTALQALSTATDTLMVEEED